MEKIKQDMEELQTMLEQLKSEQLEKIDFDKLIVQLESTQTFYNVYQQMSSEFLLLQQNIVDKITTMENTIHVVSKKRPDIAKMHDAEIKLSKMNSTELLERFKKTESRFHLAFPSTFQVGMHHKRNLKNYKSYK